MINVEEVILPNVPLSNFQLTDAAKKLNLKCFRGVFLRDELPKKSRAIECGILNLDARDRASLVGSTEGTHWCCWYKTKNKRFYFDSYGLPPPTELVNYLKSPARGRTGGVYYNSERVQPDNTVFCGHLCLYVLKKMQDGLGFQEVINTLF
jgi:hypothetical protein